MNQRLGAILGLAALAVAAASYAEVTDTTLVNVAFTAVPDCSVSASALNFGAGDSGAPRSGQSTITVSCDAGTAFNVTIDAGQNFNGSRRLHNAAGGYLQYRLLTPQGAADWGDNDKLNSFPGGSSVAGTATSVPTQLTVHGEMQADPAAPAGEYSDQVVVTVYF